MTHLRLRWDARIVAALVIALLLMLSLVLISATLAAHRALADENARTTVALSALSKRLAHDELEIAWLRSHPAPSGLPGPSGPPGASAPPEIIHPPDSDQIFNLPTPSITVTLPPLPTIPPLPTLVPTPCSLPPGLCRRG